MYVCLGRLPLRRPGDSGTVTLEMAKVSQSKNLARGDPASILLRTPCGG